MSDPEPSRNYSLSQLIVAIVGVIVAIVVGRITYLAWQHPVTPPSAGTAQPTISFNPQINQVQTLNSHQVSGTAGDHDGKQPSAAPIPPVSADPAKGTSSLPPQRTEAADTSAHQAQPPATAPSPACVGFEPWLKYERSMASAINDGYTLVFRVQNDSDREVAVSTIRTNILHDDQHNELMLRDSSLPDVLCNPPEACAAETFRNGLKVEPHTRGSMSYRFLGLGERKHGKLVFTETTVVFTRKDDDGKFITARKLISCDEVPVQ